LADFIAEKRTCSVLDRQQSRIILSANNICRFLHDTTYFCWPILLQTKSANFVDLCLVLNATSRCVHWQMQERCTTKSAFLHAAIAAGWHVMSTTAQNKQRDLNSSETNIKLENMSAKCRHIMWPSTQSCTILTTGLLSWKLARQLLVPQTMFTPTLVLKLFSALELRTRATEGQTSHAMQPIRMVAM